MKKLFLKPGFEFIFSLSLMAILGLPPMLRAQNQKDIEIKIENGDTTVNGKNIKELSAKDRKNALRDIKHLNNDEGQNVYFFKRNDTSGRRTERFELRKRLRENSDNQPLVTENMVIKDSLGNVVELRSNRRRTIDSKLAPKFRTFDDAPGKMELEGRSRSLMRRFERKNSQNFDYVNTDNEGISTHVRFYVSDISNEDLKRMPHVEGGKIEVTDLNLVPEFSTGKTLLMFNLPTKTTAEVKLIDSEGKIMWSEKSTEGSFRKTFVLGLNGIYYLQIKQGRNVSVKKIVKEE